MEVTARAATTATTAQRRLLLLQRTRHQTPDRSHPKHPSMQVPNPGQSRLPGSHSHLYTDTGDYHWPASTRERLATANPPNRKLGQSDSPPVVSNTTLDAIRRTGRHFTWTLGHSVSSADSSCSGLSAKSPSEHSRGLLLLEQGPTANKGA